jgi:hypothetical protein
MCYCCHAYPLTMLCLLMGHSYCKECYADITYTRSLGVWEY